MADRDLKHEIDRLQKGLDEVRGSLGSLVDRAGDHVDRAADEGQRRFRQYRDAAGELSQHVSHRADQLAHHANDGVSLLKDQVEDRPIASVAVAFLVGLAVGTIVAGTSGYAAARR